VRDRLEAREAAAAGADLIDLKDPSAGALGALELRDIAAIAADIRLGWPQRPVSATIGDFDARDHGGRCAMAQAVAACGVDYVKVGIAPGTRAAAALRALADLGLPSLVIVFLADGGIDLALAEQAATLGFAGLMVDTADKSTGSLLQHLPPQALRDFLAVARRHGRLCGIAGSLRQDDVPMLRQLAPDYAGFRGALCAGDRRGRLDPARLRRLRALLRADRQEPDAVTASASSSLRRRDDSVFDSSSIE
jgi:uncharacterized protein (UPF0264 family)